MEWKINKSTRGCILCERKFCDEEEYYSALFDDGNGFIRKDYCVACWKSDEERIFSFWKTKIPKKDKPVQKIINVEMFYDMFMKLQDQNETYQKNLRYVLALFLMRKRMFKLKSLKKQDEKEFMVLYCIKDDREHRVFNPELREDEIESITSEMKQLLDLPYAENNFVSNR
ncbi:MAG: hypothetical protein MRJ65_11840 [Candidatus Brocadiaceae bacterium]|nr:hypothetical protein [Candidatus Brocadiaceae bacterium]